MSAGAAAQHKFRQLADVFVAAFAAGDYQPGDRLPSLRDVCRAHAVSMNTAQKAFHELERLGYIAAVPRAGFRLLSRPAGCGADGAAARSLDELLLDSRLPAPLGSPFVNPALFDLRVLNRELARAIKGYASAANHSPVFGLDTLRRQISRLYLAEGVSLHWENLLITCGGMEALALAIQAVLQDGRPPCIAVMTPAFPGALNLLRQLGVAIVALPEAPAEQEALLTSRPLAALLLMPNFRHASGQCLDDAARQALLALADRFDVPIIEDDTYRALHFGTQAPLPLKAGDRDGRVLHCGSFSKTLAPGYRVGWLEPGRYHERVRALKLCSTLSSPLPSQLALAALLASEQASRLVQPLRRALQQRCSLLRHAVLAHFPAGTQVSEPAGGYLLWITLPAVCDQTALLQRASAVGLHFAPGSLCLPDGQPDACATLRLNASFYTPETEALLQKLGIWLQEALAA
ncbi:aminotransferase-like domain-containing protein [Chitinilyticum litopenaei]|uniref:aminotransferase-like domain-containing protein n=1 Tax=Chitinilyticum litopenaei TaxID=1121276 RepID=UPI0004226F73|nr:PLP-dependent aminotransferase family protein [Chitinilyticum litopenaei]